MYKGKFYLLILYFSIPIYVLPQWSQIGNSISGIDELDGAYRTTISYNGSTIAIGSGHDEDTIGQGQVRVFKYNNQDWNQIGSNINGGLRHGLGTSVSLNEDGTILAVGAWFATGAYTPHNDSGYFKVYEYSGLDWIQIGDAIYGEDAHNHAGYVHISSDGTTVAQGAPNNAANGPNSGHVRIFRFDGSNWYQLGNSINGEYSGDFCGTEFELNYDGSVIAIGASNNDNNGLEAGQVRIFEYNGSLWSQLGNSIYGENPGEKAAELSINSTGNTVAVASLETINNNDTWKVRVLKYNGVSWIQKGSTITGDSLDEYVRISLDSTGNTIAIGIPANDMNGTDAGQVRIYSYINGNWLQNGAYINGNNSDDEFGMNVDLNANGDRIVIGETYNNPSYLGRVNVYQNCSSYDTININTCNDYISPSGNYTWNLSGFYSDTLQNSIGCDSIIYINLTSNTESNFSVTVCDSGQYISPSGNYTWTTSGIFKDTISNTNGCDSLITIDLTITITTYSNNTIVMCDNNSIVSPSGNYIWTSPGVYSDTIQNVLSCDSVMTMNVISGYNTDTSYSVTECDSIISPSLNYLWTQTGIFNDTIINSQGCDSIIIVDLTLINSPDVNLGNDIVISDQQTVLISSGINLPSYMWNTGDTTSFIVVSGNVLGIGTHIFWLYSEDIYGCSDIDTIIINVNNNLLINDISNNNFNVTPNPTTGKLYFKIDNYNKIEIINSLGQILYETKDNITDIKHYSNGIYFYKVYTDKQIITGWIIKR